MRNMRAVTFIAYMPLVIGISKMYMTTMGRYKSFTALIYSIAKIMCFCLQNEFILFNIALAMKPHTQIDCEHFDATYTPLTIFNEVIFIRAIFLKMNQQKYLIVYESTYNVIVCICMSLRCEQLPFPPAMAKYTGALKVLKLNCCETNNVLVN